MKTTLLLFSLLYLSLEILDRSYYDALCTLNPYIELPVSASQADIRDAFRRLSKKYHPDRNPGFKERFGKINVGKTLTLYSLLNTLQLTKKVSL